MFLRSVSRRNPPRAHRDPSPWCQWSSRRRQYLRCHSEELVTTGENSVILMKKIYLNKEKKKTFPACRQGLPRKYAAGFTNCHISDRKEYSPVIRCVLLPQLANARVEAPKNTTAGQTGNVRGISSSMLGEFSPNNPNSRPFVCRYVS